jgi:hypothetical protein
LIFLAAGLLRNPGGEGREERTHGVLTPRLRHDLRDDVNIRINHAVQLVSEG